MLNDRRLGVVRFCFRLLPEMGAYGVKRRLLRWAGAEVGEGVKICSSAFISGGGVLIIGNRTWIGSQALLRASPGSTLRIGNDVDIAPRVSLWTGTHNVQVGGNKAASSGLSKDITIDNGAWLAMGSMVMPGCSVGECAVLAAGAVASKDIQDRVLVAGVPARAVRYL